MSRIFSEIGQDPPRIDRESVVDFFEQRAAKVQTLGLVRAVIYQDKDPSLADRRDVAEKQLLLPKLELESTNHVLDLGCGTGRWTGLLAARCARYHGVDVSSSLIEIAKSLFKNYSNVDFSTQPVDRLSKELFARDWPFHRVVCFGVLMYLNDDEVLSALSSLAELCSARTRILIREPVGIEKRLTIKEHFSEDMDQIYNAIYRTESELAEMMIASLGREGFAIADRGDVYPNSQLNNREETKQRWYVLTR